MTDRPAPPRPQAGTLPSRPDEPATSTNPPFWRRLAAAVVAGHRAAVPF